VEGVVSLYDACGRSNERPYRLDEVGFFNNTLIIIRLYDACGRSNERPYLSAVRMSDDRAAGVYKLIGPRDGARPMPIRIITSFLPCNMGLLTR